MPYRFVHVGFAFPGALKMRDLEPAFTRLGDWVRYSALCWIVWTDKPTPDIFVGLRPFLDKDDQVLIAPLNATEVFGTLSPWIWEWLKSKERSNAITYGEPVRNALLPYITPPPKTR